MKLFPAIDLLGGQVVQLVQGDFNQGKVHGNNPAEVAQRFVEAGCPWVHCVDLDAARTGEAHNSAAIAAVAQAISVPLQVGGGVRSEESARRLVDLGVTRVVMGTAAVSNPALVEQVAKHQRVAIGLDIRGREVAVEGWTKGSGQDWTEALARLENAGAEAVIVTQIKGEGLMGGPDLSGLQEVLSATKMAVIASGGVGTLADLEALKGVSVGEGAEIRTLEGVIVGTALYEKKFSIKEAVEVLQ
ncbi:MAG: 1-(5-phosphoribosyl)-5-[(5-phosphoribosylamino)methylideneamino]imidazole-4-carboxamide isomerase [Acidimicrobiia bacterium]